MVSGQSQGEFQLAEHKYAQREKHSSAPFCGYVAKLWRHTIFDVNFGYSSKGREGRSGKLYTYQGIANTSLFFHEMGTYVKYEGKKCIYLCYIIHGTRDITRGKQRRSLVGVPRCRQSWSWYWYSVFAIAKCWRGQIQHVVICICVGLLHKRLQSRGWDSETTGLSTLETMLWGF